MELYPIQYVCTGILPEGLAWRTSSGSWHFWLPIARFLVQLYKIRIDARPRKTQLHKYILVRSYWVSQKVKPLFLSSAFSDFLWLPGNRRNILLL